MGAGHDRYDELAVGHVLGGLDPVDSAEFRSHLLTCRSCRLRVAELRDLASELAAAEREERALARLKTEVRHSDAEDDAEDDGEEPGSRRALPLIGIISLVVLAAAFWAYQIRGQNSELLAATERREATLAMLAEGEVVEAEMAAGLSGIVVVDGPRVGMTLAGLPDTLPDGEVVVLWRLGPDDRAEVVELLPGPFSEGRLALHAAHGGADTLLLTVQPMSSVADPDDPPLVRADLDPTDRGSG